MEMGSGYLEDCENKKFSSNIYEYADRRGQGQNEEKNMSVYIMYIYIYLNVCACALKNAILG